MDAAQSPAVFSLKLLVDSTNNKVIFAEAEKEFVDVLLSFLTLPMGTIISTLNNKRSHSNIGSMDGLYRSVGDLCSEHFNTETCKAMLLRPWNSSARLCKSLRVNLDETPDLKYYYRCCSCDIRKTRLSYFKNAPCLCGNPMTETILRPADPEPLCGSGGNMTGTVFVKGMSKFMISDDLTVTPASTGRAIQLIGRDVANHDGLEEKLVGVGHNEILKLLQLAFSSLTPLTDLFFYGEEEHSQTKPADTMLIPKQIITKHQVEEVGASSINRDDNITIKVMINKCRRTIMYAEAGEDFVDLLISLLAFPVGSVMKNLLEKGESPLLPSSAWCLSNFYRSVHHLGSSDLLNNEECVEALVDPKLPHFFSCKSRCYDVEEKTPAPMYICRREDCDDHGVISWRMCRSRKHIYGMEVELVDPKMPGTGGFLKTGRYMVTDELVVSSLSPLSGLSILRSMPDVSLADVEEKTVVVGKNEALNLLEACLRSKSVLTDAFIDGCDNC